MLNFSALCHNAFFTTLHTSFYVLNTLLFKDLKGSIEMPRRNDLEHKALHLISTTGDQGVLQSEMWQELDASSREGSRIAIKLENKGLIRRERVEDGPIDSTQIDNLYPLIQSLIVPVLCVQLIHAVELGVLSHPMNVKI